MRLCGSTVGDETSRNILLICLKSNWRQVYNDVRSSFFTSRSISSVSLSPKDRKHLPVKATREGGD